MGSLRMNNRTAGQYDLNSLARGKLIEGLVLLCLGAGGFFVFLLSAIGNVTIESELPSYGVFPELVFLGCILFVSSVYMIYEGTSTIGQAGLTPFWKCSDKRIRHFYITFGSSKSILSSMALYDLEPDVRDLALEKLNEDSVIDTYLNAKKTDSYLYVEKIEAMIALREKAINDAKLALRTDTLSTDSPLQLQDILKGNPTRSSAKIIVSQLSDRTVVSELVSSPHVKPWLKEMLEKRQSDI